MKTPSYTDPYHHFAQDNGICFLELGFGLEYLNYMGFVSEWLAELKPSTVLDFGCGDGRFVKRLAPSVSCVVGIEMNERAAQFASLYVGEEAEIVTGDLSDYKERWESRFDAIVAIEVMEHVSGDELAKLKGTFLQVLRPGGYMLVCVPSRIRPTQAQHYRHYDLELLGEHFGQFEIVKHGYCHKVGITEKILRNLLSNRYLALKESAMQRFLYSLYKRTTRTAAAGDGAHVVALFRAPR